MKKYIKYFLIVALFISCQQQKSTQKEEATTVKQMSKQGKFAHTVYFWLKKPDNSAERAAFEKSLKKFISNSTYILSRHIGTPANTGDRNVVDDSYTYSLLLTFKDKNTQDLYQNEPAHKQFLKESSELWSKVIVYDSENILD